MKILYFISWFTFWVAAFSVVVLAGVATGDALGLGWFDRLLVNGLLGWSWGRALARWNRAGVSRLRKRGKAR